MWLLHSSENYNGLESEWHHQGLGYWKQSQILRQRDKKKINWGLSQVFFLCGWHKRSFVLCLHEEKNSLRLLMVAPSGLNIMKYFSVRQSRHCLVTGLKLGAKASCLNLIEYLMFLSLSFHICLERHVAVLFAFVSLLKLALWLFHRNFQLGSLNPV